jgi:hypothetical protein
MKTQQGIFCSKCVVAREVWHICREQLELNIEEPRYFDTIEEWWINKRLLL